MQLIVDHTRILGAVASVVGRERQVKGGPVFLPVLALAMVIMLSAAACSTGLHQPSDPWMRGYLDDPDRVWAANLQVLDDLGYQVEESDRFRGTIRAVSAGENNSQGIVLQIDQVMRTDVVRVYVHAGGASTGQRADMKVLEKAALDFLGALDRMLGVSPQ